MVEKLRSWSCSLRGLSSCKSAVLALSIASPSSPTYVLLTVHDYETHVRIQRTHRTQIHTIAVDELPLSRGESKGRDLRLEYNLRLPRSSCSYFHHDWKTDEVSPNGRQHQKTLLLKINQNTSATVFTKHVPLPVKRRHTENTPATRLLHRCL